MIRTLTHPEIPRRDNPPDSGYHPVQTYTDLRTMVFGIDLRDLAQRKTDTLDRVWGVVMEAGYPDAAITLIALGDGTVSLYLSSGGGMTGLGDYELISDAAHRLIGLAGTFTSECETACEFPLPQKGSTRFYLLTYTGTLSIELAEHDLYLNPVLAPLLERGHELLVMIRTLGEQLAEQRAGQTVTAGRPN